MVNTLAVAKSKLIVLTTGGYHGCRQGRVTVVILIRKANIISEEASPKETMHLETTEHLSPSSAMYIKGRECSIFSSAVVVTAAQVLTSGYQIILVVQLI